jgi:hypothetical protein
LLGMTETVGKEHERFESRRYVGCIPCTKNEAVTYCLFILSTEAVARPENEVREYSRT